MRCVCGSAILSNGSIYVEATEFGDLVKMEGDFFNNNELLPISGGETFQDLIQDAEPDLGNLDLETEEPDSTLVTECTTSGAVASVALPVGTPSDPIKRPKVKVKRI